MGYKIYAKGRYNTRHEQFDGKTYKTREDAKRAYNNFYTGSMAKYKKSDTSMKIVSVPKPKPQGFGALLTGAGLPRGNIFENHIRGRKTNNKGLFGGFP